MISPYVWHFETNNACKDFVSNGLEPTWYHCFFSAVSVGVSCFTLVTISLERYFAIVEPLRSRRWQTRSHSYKCIMGIWLLAFVLMIPIAASQEVIQIGNSDRYACREIWPKNLQEVEIGYSVSLCAILFVIPLFIMALAYGRIAYGLWVDISHQVMDNTGKSIINNTHIKLSHKTLEINNIG